MDQTKMNLFRNKFFSRREGTITLHLLFWMCYLVFHTVELMVYTPDHGLGNILGRLLLSIWVDVFAAYFTVYVLIYKYIFRKRYLLFVVLFLLVAAAMVFVQRLILYYVSYPIFFPQYFESKSFWDFYPIYTFFNIYSGTAIFASLVLLRQLFISQRQKRELENQNKNGELALLRSQISPHFLFNTLNNIDSLIFLNQKLASDSVIKLSKILRYMLYEANTDRVSLSTEVSYLKSYVKLQLLRIDASGYVQFRTSGRLASYEIAPMLLIPFVENAFKHGSKHAKPPGITILVEAGQKQIMFSISNYLNPNADANRDETSGIGLSNVQRRLELIYPGLHELEISKTELMYTVNLKIFQK